jgi:membrane protease YdiL (CAAX protease family)
MKRIPARLTLLFLMVTLMVEFDALAASPAPAAVGWGNLLVPGLGATLRGESGRGLLEATSEIGSYFGGTFYAKEGHFSIDGSVVIPAGKDVIQPLAGELLQQFGLKFHMYNTFYNYQQASLDPAYAEFEKTYQQPLYRGTWNDVLAAPFKLRNLKSAWVYVPVLLSAGFVYAQYRSTDPALHNHQSTAAEGALYGLTDGIAIPLGSSFGEEVLFRGFVQREVWLYTDSLPAAIAVQTLLFTTIHALELRPAAFAGGIYFGVMANHFEGDLEPGIAAHFWVDFVNGVFQYFLYRKSEGKSVPLSARVAIPF